ncbi:MAG: 3'-5' exonuclease [Natrialbaceae archaeon]|nr:3'-5' exonuclease [Natrialbaceae archaeon]
MPQRDAGDVAVIVRTNRQAAEISTALREARLPHTVTGSPTVGLTPGIQTVISLFRVLVDPSADEHLRRILMVRYRLHEDDLERLHATPETLNRALKSIDPADCRDPARIERVKADLHHLRSIQDSMPLSRFVEELFETTSIGWFLETRERETLDRIAAVR